MQEDTSRKEIVTATFNDGKFYVQERIPPTKSFDRIRDSLRRMKQQAAAGIEFKVGD